MSEGTVHAWDAVKGFGFIDPDEGGRRLFVHFTGIDMPGRRDLEVGQRVRFDVEIEEKGPRAVAVQPLEELVRGGDRA